MRPQRKGFTLVELLVVIGIIALLISVLMPALNQARSAARQVQCLSNSKQIYNAILMYSTENKGLLPFGSHPIGWNNQYEILTTNGGTYLLLSKLMGYPNTDPMNTAAEIAPVFRCPELPGADEAGLVWAPGLSRSILFHPRAFPPVDRIASDPTEWPQRKLASIRNGADKIAFFDASVAVNWNMMTPPQPEQLDAGRGWYGHMFAEQLKPETSWENLNALIDNGPNVDNGSWYESGTVIRFRHNKNKNTVLAFFDGHSETRTVLGQRPGSNIMDVDIKRRDICITHHVRK